MADAQRPRVEGGRPDSNRRRRDHDPECLPLHDGHSGDGRARTDDLSPDKRALWPSELRPHWSRAGGIRTHGLELMRLARTTAPLPRSGRAGRGRTCDAPRFKRALYRPSYGHVKSVQPPVGMESSASSPTMLSTPLAYPSTLDRRLGARRPPWRGVGARLLARCHCKLACESHTYIHTRNYSATSSRTFSLRRGLKWDENFSS